MYSPATLYEVENGYVSPSATDEVNLSIGDSDLSISEVRTVPG